jgi:hypothetical protein
MLLLLDAAPAAAFVGPRPLGLVERGTAAAAALRTPTPASLPPPSLAGRGA